MIPLVMIMVHILFERMPEEAFPKQDEPRQALLLDGSHSALRVGVQIWRPRWQRDARDPSRVDELLKGGAIFPIPIMDQVLPGRQEAPLLHRDIAGHLDHPRLIGMGRHARDMD